MFLRSYYDTQRYPLVLPGYSFKSNAMIIYFFVMYRIHVHLSSVMFRYVWESITSVKDFKMQIELVNLINGLKFA